MRKILLIFSIFLIQNCTKPKTVLICGDHICVNKKEAEQYFEKNLSIEVKVLSKKNDKKDKKDDLVELNLETNLNNKREVYIKQKEKTNQEIKTLSKEEISKIKNNLKKKENKKNKIVKKTTLNKNKKKQINDLKKGSNEQNKIVKNVPINYNKNKRKNGIIDICTVVQKCNIDEISKFLIKEGQKKNFPDITTRE